MKLPRQRTVVGLGEFIDTLYNTLPVLSLSTFVSVMVLLFASVPLLFFVLSVITIFVLSLIGGVVVYKFVLPSLWTWRSSQMFGFKSDVTDKLEKILRWQENYDEKNKGIDN